jgi:hypothetical protein
MTEGTVALNPRTQAEVEIIAKAWKDDAFKQALLDNPKAVVEQELSTTFPTDLKVSVVEAQPNHFYLRLPAKPEIADSLSLADLVQSLSETDGEAIATLIAKSRKDVEFKRSLLSDPKTALAAAVGTELPTALEVEILEEDANTLVLLLPMKPDTSDVELSDEELEGVAGGTASILAAIGKAVMPNAGAILLGAAAQGAKQSTLTAAQVGARVVAGGAAATTVAGAAGGTAGANQVYKFW